MKKASLTVLFSLSLLAGAAYAQSDEGGVKMSTDPQTAADVEQRAQAIQQQQEQMPMQENEPMEHKGMHHKAMHHKHPMKSKAGKAEAASGASE